MVSGLVPHVGGPVLPAGHPQTLIGGLPAARLGDKAVCVGPIDVIVQGAPTVLIGGLPAARMGDRTAHGGMITLGCPTVLIGDSGSGSAGTMQGMAMLAAKQAHKPFCEECAKHASGPPSVPSAQAQALSLARANHQPFCEQCEELHSRKN